LATHSKVIDAMLATSMRESQTGRIDFPKLSAEVWESMIYFLDPATSRRMTVQDALQVAAAYDEYDFCDGANCCDQVLVELFGTEMPCGNYEPDKKPEDLNQLIDTFLLADVANLKQTKKRAVQYFKGALLSAVRDGHVIFDVTQIKKLAPLIAKENLLGESFTNDEILQSLFPKFFVNSGIISKTNHIVDRAVVGLTLSGTSFSHQKLKFTAESSCSTFTNRDDLRDLSSGNVVVVKIARLTDDWVIYQAADENTTGDENKFFWNNPFSENMPLPPESGWVSTNTLCTGTPKIEYLYRSKNN
jgi:hypothetical protein